MWPWWDLAGWQWHGAQGAPRLRVSPRAPREMDLYGSSAERSSWLGMESLAYERRLRALGLLSPAKAEKAVI